MFQLLLSNFRALTYGFRVMQSYLLPVYGTNGSFLEQRFNFAVSYIDCFIDWSELFYILALYSILPAPQIIYIIKWGFKNTNFI